jgi:phosphohistidine phosphatase
LKRAILLRHASARDAPLDALRELTPQGMDEAARAGARIAALGTAWAPTLALCSTALRATATLASVRPALAALARSELDARLYLASAGELLAALRRAPEAEACVLVVAHEPGISALVHQLAKGAEPDARARLARGMPPASFAALVLDVARWADARPACAEIAAFERP